MLCIDGQRNTRRGKATEGAEETVILKDLLMEQ